MNAIPERYGDNVPAPQPVGTLGEYRNPTPKSGVAGAAVAGMLSLITSVIGNVMQHNAVSEQNRYNSPAEQMKRYKEAGLNPHLIYSQGSNGNQSVLPNYQMPDLAGAMAQGAATAKSDSDIMLQRYQADNLQAQNGLIKAQTAAQLLSNPWIDKEKKALIADLEADTLLKNAQGNATIQKLPHEIELLLKQIDATEEQKNVYMSTVAKLDSETALNYYELNTIKPQEYANMQETNKLLIAQTLRENNQAEQIDYMTKNYYPKLVEQVKEQTALLKSQKISEDQYFKNLQELNKQIKAETKHLGKADELIDWQLKNGLRIAIMETIGSVSGGLISGTSGVFGIIQKAMKIFGGKKGK